MLYEDTTCIYCGKEVNNGLLCCYECHREICKGEASG